MKLTNDEIAELAARYGFDMGNPNDAREVTCNVEQANDYDGQKRGDGTVCDAYELLDCYLSQVSYERHRDAACARQFARDAYGEAA